MTRSTALSVLALLVAMGVSTPTGAEVGSATLPSECESAQVRLFDSLRQSDRQALEAAQSSVDGCRERLDQWLLEAAEWQAPRTVALLLDEGASARTANGAGWTALHHAVTTRGLDLDARSESRWIEVTRLLLDAGADVNAATDLVGWTPLHLAAGGKSAALVDALLAGGALPNARTYHHGWTPLSVAKTRGNAGVVAALTNAGAGGLGDDVEPAVAPSHWAGGRSVAGSFTRPAAVERLVFEPMNLVQTAVGLVGRRGERKFIDVWPRSGGWGEEQKEFLGLCRDGATNVDHLIVEAWTTATCCAPTLRFLAFDDAGDIRLMYSFEMLRLTSDFMNPHEENATSDHDARLSSAWPDADGSCRWRERKAAADTLAHAMATFRVGNALPTLGRWPEGGHLPSRAVPGAVAGPLVEAVRAMPKELVVVTDVLRTYRDDAYRYDFVPPGWPEDDGKRPIDSERWEVVSIVGSGRGRDGNVGSDAILLARDGDTGTWHSIHDCAVFEAWDLRRDILFGTLRGTGDGQCERWAEIDVSIDLDSRYARRLESEERFENTAVKVAYFSCELYRDCGTKVSKRVFLEFDVGDTPDTLAEAYILALAEASGLGERTVEEHATTVLWSFAWPYWRLGTAGVAFCDELEKRTGGRWKMQCGSNDMVPVWPD